MILAPFDPLKLKALLVQVHQSFEVQNKSEELNAQNDNHKLVVTPQPVINQQKEEVVYAPKTRLQGDDVESDIAIEERVAILVSDADLPYHWAEAVTRVLNCSKPRRLPVDNEHWQIIRRACKELCKNDFKWLKILIKYGYSVQDVFGFSLTYPLSTFESKGFILWLDRAQSIQNVFEDKITVVSFTRNVVVWHKPNDNQPRILIYELT